MTPNAIARPIEPGDAEALSELFAALEGTPFHPHPLTAEEARRLVAYEGRDAYGILAEGEELVAYGILRGWDDGFSVPSLGVAVHPQHQGRGYGRAMMRWLEEQARHRGAQRIRLRVHADNLAARRLYESLGYAEAGEERGELVMMLELDQ
jgi:ribosomal protein S18 acetylase RimI-like enzyme